MEYILDIGAGKYNSELIKSDPDKASLIVHLDRCYGDKFGNDIATTAKMVQQYIYIDQQKGVDAVNGLQAIPFGGVGHLFCGCDAFDFMDNFPIKAFDKIICNRMFEHLEYCGGEVGRMLEACNAISKYKATLEFVVPNAETLAKMVLQENDLTDNDVMIINTEFCNGKFDPHASVWTPRLAKKYIEQEDTWQITKIIEKYPFAGRDIYMKVFCCKPSAKQHNKELDNGNS